MMIDHLSGMTAGVGKTTGKTTGGANAGIGIAYIYCDYRDQKNQNIANIVGSITNQLLESLTNEDIDRISDEVKLAEKMKGRQVSLDIAMCMLKVVLKLFDHTFICIDAVDELEVETQCSFMKSLREICTINDSSGGILLCFTARPHVKDMVTKILGENSQSVTITANDDDIHKYILHKLETDRYPKLVNDELEQQLLTKIPMSSQGMYVHAPASIGSRIKRRCYIFGILYLPVMYLG